MNRSLLFLSIAVLIIGAGCSRQQSTAPATPSDNTTTTAPGNEPNATTPPSTAPGGAPNDNTGGATGGANGAGSTTGTPPSTGTGTSNPQGGTSNQ